MKSNAADTDTEAESATKTPKIQKIQKKRNPVYQEQDVQRKHTKKKKFTETWATRI